MTGFGEKLKAAREQKGLSQSQLAASTRILIQIIQGLEEENFSRIVAPIYGRGFAKLYAEQVGLNPEECAEEFMIAYHASKGNPAAGKKVQKQNMPPENAEPPKADIFTKNRNDEEDEISRFFGEAPKVGNRIEKKRPGAQMPLQMRFSKLKSFTSQKRVWRLAALSVLAIAFVWLAVASIRSLYNATSSNPAKKDAALNVKTGKAVNARPRTPIKNTPELYFD